MSASYPLAALTSKRYVTATNSNVLSGTQLESAPYNCTYMVLIAADNATTTATITAPGAQAALDDFVVLRTNGIPDASADVGYIINLAQGQRPVIAIGGTVSKCTVITQVFPR